MRKIVMISSIAAAALVGCTPYQPSLGQTPYLCAVAEPRCPDSYECVPDNMGKEICVEPGYVVPDAPLVVDFVCAEDGMTEPNEDIGTAFLTDVGAGVPERIYGPISICPEGDRDTFQVTVGEGQGVEVITSWEEGEQVQALLLISADTVIANGTAHGFKARRACAANLPAGVYFGRAISPMGLKNNYRIRMRIVDNCALEEP